MSNDMKLIMESWREKVLKEAEWDNQGHSDNDWPGGQKKAGIVFFNKDSKYSVQGKTHDVNSHVIKHAKDTGFGQDLESVNQTFKILLKKYIDEGNKVYYNFKGEAKELSSEDVNNLNSSDLRNTLDRIYDSSVAGDNILPIEKNIISLLKPLKDKYVDASEDTVENPQASAQFDKKKAFVKDGKLAITYDDKIVTFYGDKRFKKDPTAVVNKAVQPRK